VLQHKGIYKTTHHRDAPLKTGVRLNYIQTRSIYLIGNMVLVLYKDHQNNVV